MTIYEITAKKAGAVSITDDEGLLLGLVTDYDIREFLEQDVNIFSRDIAEIMNNQPTYIFSDEKAFNALEVMQERETPFLVLPVLDRTSRQVVGMIHLHDLVAKGL